jgi:LuxR family quorum-sensing transcriptional regulator LasR
MKSTKRFTALLTCRNERAWLNSVIRMAQDYGFEQVLIALSDGQPSAVGNVFLRGNFSSQWLETYDRKKFLNIDPAVAYCATHSTPVLWREKIFTGKKQKEMSREAANFGLHTGMSLPFHGANGEMGILCLAKNVPPSQQVYRDMLRVTPELSLMRDYAFQGALRFFNRKINISNPILTQRELECLKWCATGKASWEIAQILACTEATVNYHILNLRRKLNADSRRQAVINAIHLGLVNGISSTYTGKPARENGKKNKESELV